MPIPSVAQWQKKTSSCLRDRNNPLILDIDTLLGAYHTTGKTDVQKQKILILMLYICTEWLVTKSKGNWRRPYVRTLVTNIETELRSAEMQQATQDRLTGRPGLELKENKLELLQPRDLSTKLGLTGGTQFHRVSGKNAERFISGYGQRNLAGHLEKLQNVPINDYVDELKILAAGNAGQLLEKNLIYLSKGDRLNYQLTINDDNRLHLYGKHEPYSSNPQSPDLFAMDSMELIYVSKDKRAGVFHHSSFFSGRPVKGAGEIGLANGLVNYINNISGHYLPSTQDLLNVVTILRDRYGCNLANIKLFDGLTKKSWATAAEFLLRQGVPQVAVRTATATGGETI